jgi:CobQ-like glutamine amidotransferase family enzyme
LRQPLVGFENHQGETHLGPGARPLGTIAPANRRERPREEGAVDGGVIGTYLHGPVLALNAELADLLLARVLGPLTPLVDTTVHQARRTRLDGGRRRR